MSVTTRGRRSALAGSILGVALGLGAACFSGTFLAGQPCSSDADCGPELRCEEGRCGGATGSAEGDGHEACEDVDPACESFFECAASRPCAKDPVGDFWKIDTSGCMMPEGVNCVAG